MTPEQFIQKWKAAELKESSAAQSHFIDLCRMLEEPAPTDVDPTGDWYAFERGATKTTGGEGWADVWKRNHFGWEYKGKRKDLDAAFAQLQQYALALENPPLLVVCDMERFRIRTNWTNSVSATHEFELEDLRDASTRQKLKWVLSDPERLRPGKTRQSLTEEAAAEFAKLAQRLRDRGHAADVVAHFINRLVFCMFAEDVELLPKQMFKRMLEHTHARPDEFNVLASDLFRAMQAGGRVGFERVEWFNGGLFNDEQALPLVKEEIALVQRVADLDWSEIDPSILGTLFERGLDPGKRSQLGAHYTDRDKIMLIVDPVIVKPWIADWDSVKAEIDAILVRAGEAKSKAAGTRIHDQAVAKYRGFLDRLRKFRVLDPACGSGNFLYLALLALKDIEHRASIEAEALGLQREFPQVSPASVKGIEINPFAAELARVSVWVGEIQWMRRNGFGVSRDPILKPLDTIECRDAVLSCDGKEAPWPTADVVIGNPPFLGNKKMISTLGEVYTKRLRAAYKPRLSSGTDLVAYWVLKAWEMVERGETVRAGLVATNSIRAGANRKVLSQIVAGGRFFDVWDDEPWVVEGASVRVSLICFDRAKGGNAALDGKAATHINADLTTSAFDLTSARQLRENKGVSFVGVILNGAFEVDGTVARNWLREPRNVNGCPNSDVLRPTLNGDDFNGQRPDKWVVDFGVKRTEAESAYYQSPFHYLETSVKPFRLRKNAQGEYEVRAKNEREIWWRHARARPAMRKALSPLRRYVATPMVSSYRTFGFLDAKILPDQKLVVFARDDEYFLGVLQSRVHEAWTKGTCSWIGSGNDVTYANQAVFMTFPFPAGLTPEIASTTYQEDPRAVAIATAMQELNRLRDAWLAPTEFVKREPEVVPDFPDRFIAVDNYALTMLRQRTLGNLYAERPTWLANAHQALDAAVMAAYGWDDDISDEEIVSRLLTLNRSRVHVEGDNKTDTGLEL